jgi:hypothetical protein
MTKHDRAALMLALEQAREDADHATQIATKLDEDGWQEAAEFAAYCCQSRALRLRPWEEPPLVVDEHDEHERDADAQKLLREMLALGVSRYDPDPVAAIEAAKQRKAVSWSA